jgi:hypothetical protein
MPDRRSLFVSRRRHAFERALETLEPRLVMDGLYPADPPVSQRELVWLEAENPVSTTFNKSGYYTGSSIDRSLLSPNPTAATNSTAGTWLTHFVNAPTANTDVRANYSFNISRAGSYYFWIRLNPFVNNYSYRLDGAPSFTPLDTGDVGSSRSLLGNTQEIRYIGWDFVGLTNLTAGPHTLELRLTGNAGASSTHGGIDVIAFTNWNWGPTGPLKPSLTPATAGPDDWINYSPGVDPYRSDSVLDRSSLIEAPAGLRGRVQTVGDALQFADGTPAKFWGANVYPETTPARADAQARMLRKWGINAVRVHTVEDFIGNIEGTPGNRSLNAAKLDQFDRWFKAMKDQGIYVSLSMFFRYVMPLDQPGVDPALLNELNSRETGKDVYGMATFIPEYQDAQWEYTQLFMNHVNPYTGVAYKADPAILHVEQRNEDSVFWNFPLNEIAVTTFDSTTGVESGRWLNHLNRLRRAFGTWVKAKYASDAALTAAWGSYRQRVDNWAAGIYAVNGAWQLGANGPTAGSTLALNNIQRARDVTEFLATQQKQAYETYRTRMRDLGYQGMIITTNWQSGAVSATAANLWTDTTGDLIARNDYVGSGAGGPLIKTGAVNSDTSLDTVGGSLALLDSGRFQVENKPFGFTEWNSNRPSQYGAESTPLVAYYGNGLQGWDTNFHFIGSGTQLTSSWADMSAYDMRSPLWLGQFPALSTSVMRGDIAQAGSAAARRLSRSDVFAGLDALNSNYAGGNWGGGPETGNTNVPAEVLAIGRVTNSLADETGVSTKVDWNTYWDTANSTVTSMTGQLKWDYANKFFTVNAPNQQSVVGFAGGRTHNFANTTITLNTPYASLLLTSMDGLPIGSSQKVLVTAVARDRQVGTVYSSDGTQLITAGLDALQLEPVKAAIQMLGSNRVTEVRTLDAFGSPTSTFVPVTAGNNFTIDGRYQAIHYVVSRAAVPVAFTPLMFSNETSQTLTLTFARDVSASLAAGDISIVNTTTGQPVATNRITTSWNAATNTATFTITGLLADGNYTATIASANVVDAGGLALASNATASFQVLGGDANRDGTVNFDDLLILAANYNTNPRGWSQGDFTQDSTVNFDDLLKLASNYNRTLTAGPDLLTTPGGTGSTSGDDEGSGSSIAGDVLA